MKRRPVDEPAPRSLATAAAALCAVLVVAATPVVAEDVVDLAAALVGSEPAADPAAPTVAGGASASGGRPMAAGATAGAAASSGPESAAVVVADDTAAAGTTADDDGVADRATDGWGAAGQDRLRAGTAATTTAPVIDQRRIAGTDRHDTARLVAEAGFDTSPVAVLARGDVAADALAGAPLALALDAPVLLTASDELPDPTRAALSALGTERVVVLGGGAAVSEQVVAAVEELCCTVERLAGPDRHTTAVRIAERLADAAGPATSAFVVTGSGFADALAAGGVAEPTRPVLLVERDRVPAATAAFLDTAAIEQLHVLGGTAVVGDAVVEELAAPGTAVERVAGPDRSATAVAIADAFGPEEPEVLLLARGDDPADALSAGPLAVRAGAPILLTTDPYALGAATVDRVDASRGTGSTVTVVGGPRSVSEGLHATLDRVLELDEGPAQCAAHVLGRRSLGQRAGSVLALGVRPGPLDQVDAYVRVHDPGGVILSGRWRGGQAQVRAMTDHLRTVAPDGMPLLVMADQEGGAVQALQGDGFDRMPSALRQGALPSVDLEALAARWGDQLRAAGVDLDLAPVAGVVPADVGRANAPIGRSDRQLGSDPAAVAQSVRALVRGYAASGVSTAVKHFPGLGRATGNTDDVDGVVDPTGRNDPFLAPFAAAVDAGTPVVMLSSATYPNLDPDHRALFSEVVVRDVLRGDLGFDGVVMTDDVGAAAELQAVPVGVRATAFLSVGGDLVLTVRPSDVPTMQAALVAEARRSVAFAARLDEAAWRVMTLRAGVDGFACP